MNEATEGSIENSESSSKRNTENVCQIMDFKTTPVYADDSKEKDFVATFVPTTEENIGILDQVNEIVSEAKNLAVVTGKTTEGNMEMVLKATPVTSSDEVTKMLNKATEGLSATGDLKTTPILCAEEVCVKGIQNENTSNIVFDEAISKTETENQNLKVLNAEVEMQKAACDSKRRGRKRKVPPVSDMVMYSIKSQKKSSGASFEDIAKYMEENYPVNVKALLKYNVNNFLQKSVDNGELEKIGGADARFKIKEKPDQ